MLRAYEVLLVEDDRLIAKTLKMSLFYKGFEVTIRETFQQGFETFRNQSFDLVLLDISLPDGNGLDLCREIRALNERVPILMLTAKIDEESSVRGLEGGADDYIRKPYGPRELTARMTRLLERGKVNRSSLRFGPLHMNIQKRMVWSKDVQINLGKREFEILTLLIKSSGDVVTRDQILDTLGDESSLYDRTIDSHLSHLRKKLKDAGAIQIHITSVYGVGYRLEEK